VAVEHFHPSQEQVLSVLGFSEPFSKIRFGSLAGNSSLKGWFHQLNKHFGVEGDFSYLWIGTSKTFGKTPEMIEMELMQGLNNSKTAFLYHCYNHYLVPIGFERTPLVAKEAYENEELPKERTETWIFLGDTAKTSPPIHSVKFEWIMMDLMCEFPYSLNIRHTEQGILETIKNGKKITPKQKEGMNRLREKKIKKSSHCILAFSKKVMEL